MDIPALYSRALRGQKKLSATMRARVKDAPPPLTQAAAVSKEVVCTSAAAADISSKPVCKTTVIVAAKPQQPLVQLLTKKHHPRRRHLRWKRLAKFLALFKKKKTKKTAGRSAMALLDV